MAYAAEELARDLRSALAPGEPVHWRSELAAVRVRSLAVRAALAVASAVWLAAIWLAPGKAGLELALLSAVLLVVLAFTFIPTIDKLVRCAVLVCPDRVIWRRGIPFHSPIRSIRHADITLAVVYEGESRVVLHGMAGELARFNVSAPRELALTLHVPAHVWIDRKITTHGNLFARGAIGLGAMILGTIVSQLPGDLITGTFRMRAVMAAAIMLTLAGALYLGGHWWRARSMSADQRRETACYILDPLWRGRDPYTRGHIPWWDIPGVAARMWLVRHVYGRPHDCRCDIKPLVYQPNSLVPD